MSSSNNEPDSQSTSNLLHDRYEVLHSLGKKAGRQTLLARDLQTQEQVVIKRLTFSNDLSWDDIKLFEREAETLKSLDHPAIPKFLNSFEFDASAGKGFVLVQSYIDAPSLEDRLQQGETFDEARVKAIVRALLETLVYLHDRQPPVIHRDIKPSNILLSDQAVYLVDFGSVQTLATRQGKTVTVVGTYGYMPPEQFGGNAFPASDLYALGATAIALLTGIHPADLPKDGLNLKFENHASVSPNFAAWLQKATHPNPDQRFTSARSALESLEKPWLMRSPPASVPRPPISTEELIWNCLWRSTTMSGTAGAIYSAIYATVSILEAPFSGTLVGGMIGMIWGAGLGFGNGIFLALITRLFFFPLRNPRRHRQLVGISSTVASISASYVFIYRPFSIYYSNNFTLSVLLVIVPLLISSVTIGFISQSISRWYENKSRRNAIKTGERR